MCLSKIWLNSTLCLLLILLTIFYYNTFSEDFILSKKNRILIKQSNISQRYPLPKQESYNQKLYPSQPSQPSTIQKLSQVTNKYQENKRLYSTTTTATTTTIRDPPEKLLYNRFLENIETVSSASTDGFPVDMIYCIFMPSRKKYAMSQMDQLKTQYKLVQAVTPYNLTKEDYNNLSATYDKRNLKERADLRVYNHTTKLPVALSFFLAYYDAYINNYETIAIFEDDIIFRANMSQITSAVSDFKLSTAEILYMGYCWTNCKFIGQKGKLVGPHLHSVPWSVRLVCNHALVMKSSLISKYMERKDVIYWKHTNDNTLDLFLKRTKTEKMITRREFVTQNRDEMGSTNANNFKMSGTCKFRK